MNRILAIAEKELLHITRDRRVLAVVLLLPLIQLFLFSYALSFDVRNVPTMVIDQDRTPASRAIIASFEQSGFFSVTRIGSTTGDIEPAMRSGDIRSAIVVGPGFGDDVAGGKAGQIGVFIDGSEPNSAQLGQTYASAITRLQSAAFGQVGAERLGLSVKRIGGLQPQVRLWYNPDARSAVFLVPGLIVVIITIVTVQQTATTLVREEDQGTLEQLLVSPLRRYELVVGKLLPWAGLAAVDIVVITAIALFVLAIPFRGDAILFAIASAFFVVSCLAFGLLISSRASSVEVANETAVLVAFLPAFMLSGFVFPIANMPVVIQWLSYLFPARYMMTISRGVFLKGAGWAALWPEVASLVVYAVVALVLASVSYRRKMS